MSLIDLIQFVSIVIACAAIVHWLLRMRHWPLTVAVIISMLANIGFYLARSFDWLTPPELNLYSSVRVLLMVAIIAVIPFSVKNRS
jgi:hypothetical protein